MLLGRSMHCLLPPLSLARARAPPFLSLSFFFFFPQEKDRYGGLWRRMVSLFKSLSDWRLLPGGAPTPPATPRTHTPPANTRAHPPQPGFFFGAPTHSLPREPQASLHHPRRHSAPLVLKHTEAWRQRRAPAGGVKHCHGAPRAPGLCPHLGGWMHVTSPATALESLVVTARALPARGSPAPALPELPPPATALLKNKPCITFNTRTIPHTKI